jgi:hypothetical protein
VSKRRFGACHFICFVGHEFSEGGNVIGIGSAPKASSRALIIETARTALISLLSLSMIAAGVSLGAPSPYQPNASYRNNYMPDLLTGQVQVVFGPTASTLELVRSGQLRALAVTTAKRLGVVFGELFKIMTGVDLVHVLPLPGDAILILPGLDLA